MTFFYNHHEISSGSGESGPLHGNVREGPEQVQKWSDIDQLWQISFLCPRVINLYMFLLVTRLSYMWLPEKLEDVRLLLDQRSEIETLRSYLASDRKCWTIVRESSASRIYYHQRQEVGKFGRRGNVDSHNSVGKDAVARWATDVLRILHPHANVDVEPHVGTNADIFIANNDDTNADTHRVADARFNVDGAMLGTYSGHNDEDEEVYRLVPLVAPLVEPLVVHPI
ncbi:hypothetical protein GOBAR_AA06913 [Gossypium barbadense]|uniref:Uncharacterized protein n=1 Tax=Gossypium barbadense TaxID=3634 RepID=A0A2P5YDI1_GOSBA|nr:hypothetical protein GOBAR_AA06913 [Gossypium barbadense]